MIIVGYVSMMTVVGSETMTTTVGHFWLHKDDGHSFFVTIKTNCLCDEDDQFLKMMNIIG